MSKIVFLDRDGTINVDHGYVSRIEDWEFLPGAVEAMRTLKQAGWGLVVVTNQSGIAAGRFTNNDVEFLHRHVRSELARCDIDLDAIVYCPHGPHDGCECRKPRTGLVEQIEMQLQRPIDVTRSWTVGDKPSDIGFGENLGTKTILLSSRYWTTQTLSTVPDFFADSLRDAVERIVAPE